MPPVDNKEGFKSNLFFDGRTIFIETLLPVFIPERRKVWARFLEVVTLTVVAVDNLVLTAEMLVVFIVKSTVLCLSQPPIVGGYSGAA